MQPLGEASNDLEVYREPLVANRVSKKQSRETKCTNSKERNESAEQWEMCAFCGGRSNTKM